MKLGLNSYPLILVLQEIFLYVPLRVRYCYRKGQQVQKVGQQRSSTFVKMKFRKIDLFKFFEVSFDSYEQI